MNRETVSAVKPESETLKHAVLSIAASPSIPKELRFSLRNSGVIPTDLEQVELMESELDKTLKSPDLSYVFMGGGRFEVISAEEATLLRRERRESRVAKICSESREEAPEITTALIVGGALEPSYLEEVGAIAGIKVKRSPLIHFANGELLPQLGAGMAGKDLFLVYNPDNVSNEPLMELLLQIDAARRAGAERITVVAPSFPYARGDRKNGEGSPISAAAVVQLLQSQGVGRIICLDLHAGQIEGFGSIPIDNISAIPLIAKAIANDYLGAEFVLALPDEGMAKRLSDEKTRNVVTENLGPNTTILYMSKDRIEANEVNATHVRDGKIDLSGKIVVILDDLIDTGKTLRSAARTLLNCGAQEVIAGATQGVLSGSAVESFRADLEFIGGKLRRTISRVYVANAIDLRRAKGDLIVSVSVSDILGEVIRSRALRDGRSLRDIMLSNSTKTVV